VGAIHFTPQRSDLSTEWFFAGILYAGVKIPLHEHFGLRTQMRMLGTVIDSNTAWLCASQAGCYVSGDVTGMIQGDFSVGAYLAF
jgi:hypothetical protein